MMYVEVGERRNYSPVLMHFKFLILSVASVGSHQMEETDVA